MEKIAMGAEAEIHKKDNIVSKIRVQKRYRLKELDDSLRNSRTRHEAKIFEKMPKEVLHPKLIKMDDKNMILDMEFIDGKKVRDVLDSNITLAIEIGKKIAIMHNAGIIHGDLTTSNMIYKDKKIYFIDFGLSFFSNKVEDKAVDLHLLKQALESKHYRTYEQAFGLVLDGYKEESEDFSAILSKFNQVELRGRNKAKF